MVKSTTKDSMVVQEKTYPKFFDGISDHGISDMLFSGQMGVYSSLGVIDDKEGSTDGTHLHMLHFVNEGDVLLHLKDPSLNRCFIKQVLY